MSLETDLAAQQARMKNDPKAVQQAAQTASTQASTASTNLNVQEKTATNPYAGPTAKTTAAKGDQDVQFKPLSMSLAEEEKFRGMKEVQRYTLSLPYLLSALNTDPTNGGDSDLIMLSAKLQDPEGSVREGDEARYTHLETAVDYLPLKWQKEWNAEGVFTDATRRDIRRFLSKRVASYRRGYLTERNNFVGRVERSNKRGATQIDPLDVVGEDPGHDYLADFRAYDERLRIKDARAAASATKDTKGRVAHPLVDPDTPPPPTADEQQRAHAGLLDVPPEDMQVAGEMIRAPRLDAQREKDVTSVQSNLTSTPEEAAQAVAQAQIDQGLATEAQRQEIIDLNLPKLQKWYKDTTPEQRAQPHGLDYQEADKKATLNAPTGQQTGQALANLDESAANMIGGTVAIPKDLVMSAVNGEPQGIVNAVAHPIDTLDALTEKYRSKDALALSMITDPLAVPGDVGAVLGGGGGLLRLGGRLGRGSALGDALGTAGRTAQHVGGYFDPATAAGRVAGWAANPSGPISRATGRTGAYIIGGASGVGDVPVRLAADAGWQAGRHGDTANLDAFNLNRTNPGTYAGETVDMAQNALENFRNRERQAYRDAADPFFTSTDFDTIDLTGVRQRLDDAMPERYRRDAGLPDTQRPGSHREWQRASEALDRQIAAGTVDPTVLNPRNLDAFKKDIREVVDTDPGDPTYSASMSRVVPDAIAEELRSMYPEYDNIMDRYRAYKDNDELMRRTFGLGKNSNDTINIEGTGRRLGQALRPNVNTNFGQRQTILEQLAANGEPTLPSALAGQAMSAALPRGIQGAIAGSSMGGVASGLLTGLSVASLPLTIGMSSPRLAGRLVSSGARGLGRASRAVDDITTLVDAPRIGGMRPSEIYSAIRPADDVADALDRAGSQVDLDELERLRREYLMQSPELPERFAAGGAVRRLSQRYACGGPVRRR